LKPATCMIYGLDADLILLSMLLHQETGCLVTLLREAQEFEKEAGGSEWRTLNVPGLASALGLSTLQIPSFVAAMSLLGNDFLPRSLTRTVRDDGIPALISALPSLIATDGSLCLAGFRALIEAWATTEEADMLATVKKALRDRDRHYPTDLERWNATPALHCGIAALLDSTGRLRLRDNWRDIYRSWSHASAADYCAGLAWTWDYYRGRPVDQGWFFEPHLPPLWSDIAAYLATATALQPPPILYPEPLPEWLHLLAVLPADSVERLLPPEKARLMNEVPWYWPTRWSLFDIGRSQMWECEPVLPIPSDATLRKLISSS